MNYYFKIPLYLFSIDDDMLDSVLKNLGPLKGSKERVKYLVNIVLNEFHNTETINTNSIILNIGGDSPFCKLEDVSIISTFSTEVNNLVELFKGIGR